MTRRLRRAVLFAVPTLAILVAACGGDAARAASRVPLYDDLGTLHREITTTVPLAQRYFDQGLRLVYGFNHAEAVNSFQEAARLDPADRSELLEGLGLGEGALATMVRAIYSAVGLLSFFTVGPKEAHAWTVRRGATAPEAAGKIHSDLERGFIRAEVTPIEAVIEAGGWAQAKAAGKVRLEGKDYVVAEGDVIEVRFSV